MTLPTEMRLSLVQMNSTDDRDDNVERASGYIDWAVDEQNPISSSSPSSSTTPTSSTGATTSTSSWPSRSRVRASRGCERRLGSTASIW